MKIIKGHSKSCVEAGDDYHYIWHGETFWGNKSGKRVNRANWHYWIQFRCNETHCKFLGVVDDFDLTQFVVSNTIKEK